MNIAKMLADQPLESEDHTPPLEEFSKYENPDGEGGEDDFTTEGQEAAVAEMFDAFQAKDLKSFRTALKSFVQLIKDAD